MPKARRIRVTLERVEGRTAWIIRADGESVGMLEAELVASTVHLSLVVAEEWRRRGIAKAAVGQFLGLGVWGDATTLRLAVDVGDPAGAGLARATGFSLTSQDAAGRSVWERPTPRPRVERDDPRRFLRADGRIDRYPVNAAERRALLEWVVVRILSPGEVLPEAALNERLSEYTDDVAALRRHLVDHDLVERTRSGSEYALAED